MTAEHVPATLQRRVCRRAGDRCEYCRLAQAMQEATFHVDHIEPRSAGGPTTLENLALACVSCSLRKGARAVFRDPATGEDSRIFHPRKDEWGAHFDLGVACEILGRTARYAARDESRGAFAGAHFGPRRRSGGRSSRNEERIA